MTMSNLPEDLVEEILSRVPATSLKPLRSTCKGWKALFKTPRFAEKHFRKAPKQSHVVMLKNSRVFPMNVDFNVVPPSIEFKDALDLKCSLRNSEQLDIADVFHCDGLLLCITSGKRPVVWNPCLGETRWIQHKDGYEFSAGFALGYGKNKSDHSYKILMYRNCGFDRFETYEFSSNSWRVVNTPNCIVTRYSGVTLKGNTYWIGADVDDDKSEYLLSFDFTGERFRRLCLPSSTNRGESKALSVVREEKLSVLHHNYDTSKVEMWVTNKIDTEADLSWSKYFAVDDLDGYMDNCHYASTSLIIDEEKKVALCCNSVYDRGKRVVVYTIGENDKYYTEIPYDRRWGWSFIFNYVPSLVQIQSK
ncbi:unnamed protein product [Microthlaspi erraticum]|uniref:F-box domain-containing protein n=1 Tax=Microthlaspi erraticum TaxID=1685480 RepID=A0A6D2HWP1_9BRAS|nr:unnamed protein product [Microthlaspi erraticum]